MIEKPKTVLIKPRGVFKNELLERIKIGDDLLNRTIENTEELDQFKERSLNLA